jgi:hypothetical protein
MKYKLPFFYDYIFPTFILPNASVPEAGIINYIHSMHSTNMDVNLFDTPSGDINPLTFIFGNNLGSWPTTIGGLGNLQAGCYESYLEIYEDSVFLGKNNIRGKYIYPIRLSFNLTEFSAYDVKKGSKLNGEFFWKNMSDEALRDAQKGKAIIFLDYGQENYVNKNSFERLHSAIKSSNIPKENIVLGLNTFNGEEIYSSMFEEQERLLTFKNWPFVVTNTSYHYAFKPEQHVSLADFNKSKNYIRPNYFIYKVRRPRDHRLMLLYSFASSDLLEKADWSCLSSFSFNEHELTVFRHHTGLTYDSDKIQQLHQQIPHTLQSEDSSYANVSAWTDKHPQPYKDSYFYVCTETFVRGDFKSITEKVFKPIVNLLPFIFVAFPGALETLKNLGFKTFHPYIDESYDKELDVYKRINMIHQEVSRLCSMSKQELHNWYWSMEDILVYNQQHALSLYKNEELTLSLIRYLCERIQ